MSFERERRWDHRDAVEPALDEPRLDESWSAIEGRLEGRTRRLTGRRRWAAGGFVTAAAAAALLWLWWSDTPWVGTTLATADEIATVHLPEGSEVVAEPGSELVRLQEDEREVRLALREGAASFDVVRRPERLFAVEADDVEVRVVGTAFRIARLGDRVEVSVERGAVDVRRGDELVRLRAGERWSGEAELDPPAPRVAPQPVPIEDDETGEPRHVLRPGADELFTAAAEKRRAGDAREAARLYGRLVARYPSDSRAGLAAFELGRIRLDLLGNPRGAASAFRRSLALDGDSPFAQDARARLVEAHAAAGNQAACARSRDAYLARHPHGRHVVDVTRACE